MATKTWLGGNPGNPNSWSDTLNWTGGLPGDGDDAIIAVAPNEPVLDADTVSLASLTINTGANLTVGAFTLNAVTVSNSGTINGTSTGPSDAVHLGLGGQLTNSGTSSDISGGHLGVRISRAPGTVTNEGTIAGGYGGVGIYGIGGGGLITNSGASSDISGGRLGVRISNAPGTVANEGTISGGYTGVLITDGVGTVTNSGTITGAASYGSGVYLHAGGSVTNTTSGSITSGYYGVQITHAAGTVTNSGTITGATGGVFLGDSFNNTLINSGNIIGVSGPAVQFGAGSDLLEVLPGASFTGLVDGGTGTNTLELAAGTGAGTLTGLGTTVTNFNTLEFDSSAQWVLGGNITGLGGANAITGFSTTDTIDLTGFVAVSESFANNALVLTDASSTQATLQIQGPFSSGDFHLSSDGVGGTDITVCYAAGTHILTATGERLVETLLQGDLVLTVAGDGLSAQPVKWVGQRRIDLVAHPHPETVAPIRIGRGAFADNMPHSELLLSPDHAIFVDGKLICARQLINGTTIRQDRDRASVEYFHVELDSHAILLAEGMPAESYLNTGNRGFFANADEPLVLHPDLTDETDYPARGAGSCAPFVSDESNVRPVWQRLAERAAALGHPAAQVATTADPELHIVAKGRMLRPLYCENDLHVFVLPKGATEARVVSRAGSPTDVRPWLDDRRCLGVYVERIVLRDATYLQEIPVDHPGLLQGWWAVEKNGVRLRRWTNGEGVLPLPASDGLVILEIRASSGAMSYVINADENRRAA
jgi:hypothetical protein